MSKLISYDELRKNIKKNFEKFIRETNSDDDQFN